MSSVVDAAGELQYLRIGNTWTKVIEKGPKPAFVANTTGTPIEFYLSEEEVPSGDPAVVDAKVYVAGGSIGQVCVDKKFMYARAIVKNPDKLVTIVVGTTPIGDTDVAEQASLLDKLILEVMRLTQRVNENEVAEAERAFDYYKFLRFVVDSHNTNQSLITTLSTRIADLYFKVFAVEKFFGENIMQLFTINTRLDALEKRVHTIGPEGLAGKLNDALQQILELQKKFEIIDPIIKDAQELAQSAIRPVKDGLEALNNTLTIIATRHTENEVLKARDELIKQYANTIPEAVPVIRSLATMLVNLSHKLDGTRLLVVKTETLEDLEPTLPDHTVP